MSKQPQETTIERALSTWVPLGTGSPKQYTKKNNFYKLRSAKRKNEHLTNLGITLAARRIFKWDAWRQKNVEKLGIISTTWNYAWNYWLLAFYFLFNTHDIMYIDWYPFIFCISTKEKLFIYFFPSDASKKSTICRSFF